ncbi:MAG: carbohydrate kinase [Verrucomicrobia bacterium]|nr:carbohydrate kinase [Verrucomicrobiota bacterium]
MTILSAQRVSQLLESARQLKVLVIGDVMLDQFIWGRVGRISPEAPVPVVEFQRESFMPGGAANVARNLTAFNISTELLGVVGQDEAAKNVRRLLSEAKVGCEGLLSHGGRLTSIKTRIIAHQQQVVRVDRETGIDLDDRSTRRLLGLVEERLANCAGVIVGDYGKGVVTQPLLEQLKLWCRQRGIWLSLDPKPIHRLDLSNLSLVTPNRKEAFELAGVQDSGSAVDPLANPELMQVSDRLLNRLNPALLLITLGDHGMLLCHRGQKPFHIPTVAQEVFDVSGAGDTVIATFTMAIAAGASPIEAAIFSNHAAGVVVGKIGTATVSPSELLASFKRKA